MSTPLCDDLAEPAFWKRVVETANPTLEQARKQRATGHVSLFIDIKNGMPALQIRIESRIIMEARKESP